MRETHCFWIAFWSLRPNLAASSLGTRDGRSSSVRYAFAPFFMISDIHENVHMLKMFAVSSGLSIWPFSGVGGLSSGENSTPRHSKAQDARPMLATAHLRARTGRRSGSETTATVLHHTTVQAAYSGHKRRRIVEDERERLWL